MAVAGDAPPNAELAQDGEDTTFFKLFVGQVRVGVLWG